MAADLTIPRFSPLALRAARVLAGVSQTELAQFVGTSRQWIVGIESGASIPNDVSRAALADVLQVPAEFLSKAPGSPLPERSLFMRSKKYVPAKDSLRARVGVEMFVELAHELTRRLRFPGVTLPRIAARSDAEIGIAASECRRALKIPLDAPIEDVTRTLEWAGIFVIDANTETEAVDAFSLRGPPANGVIVRTTAKGSTSRRRFDVAHETAHLILHEEAAVDEAEAVRFEAAADSFAGQFLIPREQLKREFPRLDGRFWPELFRMKARWGVSLQALIVQATHANMIPDAKLLHLWKTISARGWRRREPEEPAAESPHLLHIAFEKLHSGLGVKPRDVLAKLRWNDVVFRRVVGTDVAGRILDIGSTNIVKLSVVRGSEEQRTPRLAPEDK
jgi:Zn-dependent peptidase ImmA (M78 family)/DNA-binding XRE family transcriptional regulator